MGITENQIEKLAKPIVGMADEIERFFEIPENQRRYREWYFNKYGTYPEN